MRFTIESLNKSSERILHNLLIDDESQLSPEDEILLNLPIVDFLLRKYNKASYINEKRYRFIKCILCDKQLRLKDKNRHKQTKLHKRKIKLSEEAKEKLDEDDIFIEMKQEENIN